MERLHTSRAEVSSWTCPMCGARNRELADEAGDHPCGRCGWEPYTERQLRSVVRDFVACGGYDAFDFACLAYPRFMNVPGREIQRIIDKERAKSG